MVNQPRYAIYSAPEQGSALERFGVGLLGYDAYRGIDAPFPSWPELPADWHALTRDPRKYGFHATLKPPMTLSPGKSEDDLLAACKAFADVPRTIPMIRPVVDLIDGFAAVIPAERSADLEALAADSVRDLDPFRAPLTEHDRARRNPSKLTPRQRDHLEQWGYPYVFEEFRFHMTLTGRLDAERRGPVLAMLQDRFRECGVDHLSIDRIVLFRQPQPEARFDVIGQWLLKPSAG
jgi:putative phosphonate metabolism protein